MASWTFWFVLLDMLELFGSDPRTHQVNNASSQWPKESLEEITDEQLELTFRTNIFSMFYMARCAPWAWVKALYSLVLIDNNQVGSQTP